jgi:hypothetical protein
MKLFLMLFCCCLISLTVDALPLDLKKQVNTQVTRLRHIEGVSENRFFELPSIASSGEDSPVSKLINYGMDAIPHLIPYLADTSKTKAIKMNGKGYKKRAQLNEYILFIVNSITKHTFHLPDETIEAKGHKSVPYIPNDLGQLQTQVHLWWADNRTLSLLERKIADISDSFHGNRFSAYEYLSQSANEEARLALAKRLEKVIKSHEMSSLAFEELDLCATSLTKIDTEKSVPLIQNLCTHYLGLYEQGNGWIFPEIFRAYQLLAKVGHKEEAVAALGKFKEKYFEKLPPENQKEFLAQMEQMTKGQINNLR